MNIAKKESLPFEQAKDVLSNDAVAKVSQPEPVAQSELDLAATSDLSQQEVFVLLKKHQQEKNQTGQPAFRSENLRQSTRRIFESRIRFQ